MKIASFFHPKARLWLEGRKNIFSKIEQKIQKDDRVIWMHVSSLGEYEQGLPVLTALRGRYPECKFAVSFYSPSGYEIVKDKSWADLVFYLPLDTRVNAKRLIGILHPELVIFVKYDFWYNLLDELTQNCIKTIFISAIFRPNQIYFQPGGKWFVSVLKKVSHFFVQNEKSKLLLESIGISQVTVSGDTRFDRVKMLLERDNSLKWLERFKQNRVLLVAGSTWKQDDELLQGFINHFLQKDQRVIIAPHNMDHLYFEKLKFKFKVKSALFSEIGDNIKIEDIQVIILDIVGLLTKVYSYADIAYVGGAFGKEGVHNVLEPAVFGVPVVYGPIYDKFIEAEELVETQGAIVVHNPEEFNHQLQSLFSNPEERKSVGAQAQRYILEKPDSTEIIMESL